MLLYLDFGRCGVVFVFGLGVKPPVVVGVVVAGAVVARGFLRIFLNDIGRSVYKCEQFQNC
jgi:hypothetical protein